MKPDWLGELADEMELPSGKKLIAGINANPNLVQAWEFGFARNLPRVLRGDVEVLEMISTYRNGRLTTKLDVWTNSELTDHFAYILTNPGPRSRFKAYVRDGTHFVVASDNELRQYLRIVSGLPSNRSYSGNLYRSLSNESVNKFNAIPNDISDYAVQQAWGRYDLPKAYLDGGEGALYLSKTLGGNRTEISHYGPWKNFRPMSFKT